MDQEPEDWEERNRIKAEIRKAEDAEIKEDKGNLANLDATQFATKKGFTRSPEAIRESGEKLANIAAVLSVVSIIAILIGINDVLFGALIGIAVIPGIAAIFASLLYKKQTGKETKYIFYSGVFTIVVAVIYVIFRLSF